VGGHDLAADQRADEHVDKNVVQITVKLIKYAG
jgi:hypothetical protein